MSSGYPDFLRRCGGILNFTGVITFAYFGVLEEIKVFNLRL